MLWFSYLMGTHSFQTMFLGQLWIFAKNFNLQKVKKSIVSSVNLYYLFTSLSQWLLVFILFDFLAGFGVICLFLSLSAFMTGLFVVFVSLLWFSLKPTLINLYNSPYPFRPALQFLSHTSWLNRIFPSLLKVFFIMSLFIIA